MLKHILRTTLIISCALLSGCGGAFSDYSNSDLRKAFRECDYSKLSPAGAQRCNNIKRECEVRKKDSGFRC